jgi:hypothetical protein
MALAGFFLATLVAPAVLTFVLRRTPAWWVAGVAIAGVGVYLLLTLDHGDHHGEDGIGAWYEIGNFIQKIYGVLMLVYAALLLLAGRAGRKSVRKPPPIPPAKVVRE